MVELRDVTVVFVTYNSAGCIAQAIEAVPADMPVIIVDNASRDETVGLARAARPGIRVEVCKENGGYGAALNRGARLADTEFVLLSNPDILISPRGIAELLASTESFPNSFLFSPLVLGHHDEPEEFTRGGLFSPTHPLFKPLTKQSWVRRDVPDAPLEVEWVGGCVMLARRQEFLDFGGFDENIFLFFEETDLCYRATRAGHLPVFVPCDPMRHLVSLSSGPITIDKLYFRQWHYSWSRFYLARKYSERVAWWQPLYYPLLFALKRYGYALLGRKKKAAYYAAHLSGALTALRGGAARIASPWDKR